MSTERRAVLAAVLLALLVLPAAGSGAKYVFTEVADDGGEFYSLSNQVINDAGTVAFLAAIDPPLPGETARCGRCGSASRG